MVSDTVWVVWVDMEVWDTVEWEGVSLPFPKYIPSLHPPTPQLDFTTSSISSGCSTRTNKPDD